ncbi:hypothetical protein Tco_1509282 [Tanacetum coccineum]
MAQRVQWYQDGTISSNMGQRTSLGVPSNFDDGRLGVKRPSPYLLDFTSRIPLGSSTKWSLSQCVFHQGTANGSSINLISTMDT